jgi:hypothetical protein
VLAALRRLDDRDSANVVFGLRFAAALVTYRPVFADR